MTALLFIPCRQTEALSVIGLPDVYVHELVDITFE